MADEQDSKLWEEYVYPFRDFDDITLARWLCQTLSQLEGRAWRLSHPLITAYRFAAQEGNERQIWSKRMASPPQAFSPAECCRAPLLPVFSHHALENGLLCQHCGATAIEFSDLPETLQNLVKPWAEKYAAFHAVAHYDDEQMRSVGNYDDAFELAAREAEDLLKQAATTFLPQFLEFYPAIVWEDHDECLEVEPRDIETWT